MAFPQITWSIRGQVGTGIWDFQLPVPTIFLLFLAKQEPILIYVCVGGGGGKHNALEVFLYKIMYFCPI